MWWKTLEATREPARRGGKWAGRIRGWMRFDSEADAALCCFRSQEIRNSETHPVTCALECDPHYRLKKKDSRRVVLLPSAEWMWILIVSLHPSDLLTST